MKTSARNQFAGTVSAVRSGAVNDEIELEEAGTREGRQGHCPLQGIERDHRRGDLSVHPG